MNKPTTLVLSLVAFVIAAFLVGKSHSQACPRIVTRAEWGAKPAKRASGSTGPVSYIIIHHTDTPTCDDIASCKPRLQSIQQYHLTRPGDWNDIAYNFLIGGDGTIYEGRGWGKVGSHTLNYNSKGHAITFIGNFDKVSPSAQALQAAKDLIRCGVQLGKVKSDYKLIGHRDVAATSCPGLKLYGDIKTWPRYGL